MEGDIRVFANTSQREPRSKNFQSIMGIDSTPLLPWSSYEAQLLLNCSQSRQRRKTRPLIRRCPIEGERYEQSETLANDTKSRQRRASSRKEVLPYSHPTPLSITETTWIFKLLSVNKVENPGGDQVLPTTSCLSKTPFHARANKVAPPLA
jgi:hypothetical protein